MRTVFDVVYSYLSQPPNITMVLWVVFVENLIILYYTLRPKSGNLPSTLGEKKVGGN